MTPVFTICRKEFEDRLRNGWILAIALSFALFAFVIAVAGFGFTGEVGGVDSETTIFSLTSLVLYLIPLLGLLLGYDGIAGEHEQGTLDLLRAYPIQPTDLVLGKWIGLGAVLVVILTAGLAPPSILAVANGHALLPWLAFASLSVWLGLVFVALALWFSSLATQRGTVLGMALALWLVLVILFDVGVIGLLVATGGNLPTALVNGLFFLNPTSLFRFLNLAFLLDAQAMADMGFAVHTASPWSHMLALVVWGTIPLGLGVRHLQRRN